MALLTLTLDLSPRGVAVLTLNRPDQLNAFNQVMLDELHGALGELGRDARVRVVVLRGAGRHFSAGADMARPAKDEAEVRHTGFVDVFLALEALAKPSIAVVHGACVGGATAVVGCFDLVLAADSSFFSIPEVRIGVTPVGVTPVLVRAMGLRNYRRHALAGERFTAQEALRTGLVDEVHPAGEIDSAIDRAVESFLLGGPNALAGLKQHLREAYPDIADELKAAQAHHARVDTFKTPEALEGVAAFMARRKPIWYPPR